MPFIRCSVLLLLAASLVTGDGFPTARAASGDAHISIHYRVKSVRVSKGKLGPASQGPVYRVLDSGTVTRTVDLGTHHHKMTIHTHGKTRTADVALVLEPGVKEYRSYSTQLKTMAYCSSLDVEYATCVIE